MKFIFLSTSMTSIVMSISFFLSKKTLMDKEKTSPFECGFDPYLMTRSPFSLRFFKIAIIFLIFDIEIIMILPLPLINLSLTMTHLQSSVMIIFIILMGLLYEWHQGSLDWVK